MGRPPPKFSETKTLKKCAKVSKTRSFETEMSISVRKEMIALQEEEEARRSWKKNNVGKMYTQ